MSSEHTEALELFFQLILSNQQLSNVVLGRCRLLESAASTAQWHKKVSKWPKAAGGKGNL